VNWCAKVTTIEKKEKEKESNQFVVFMRVHAQMNIPVLIDGFIAWPSKQPCRVNQKTPFVDKRFLFKSWGLQASGFFPPSGKRFLSFLPPSPLFWHFFALALIFAHSKSEKCFKPAESPTETLAMQAMIFMSQFASCARACVLALQHASNAVHAKELIAAICPRNMSPS